MEIKIKLKIKDVEIELTEDEARKLKTILESLMGADRREYIPYPITYPVLPIYPYPNWEITYGDKTSDPLPQNNITICYMG